MSEVQHDVTREIRRIRQSGEDLYCTKKEEKKAHLLWVSLINGFELDVDFYRPLGVKGKGEGLLALALLAEV